MLTFVQQSQRESILKCVFVCLWDFANFVNFVNFIKELYELDEVHLNKALLMAIFEVC